MTIQFNCPKCDAVIGFDDKHVGKHAHCTSCGQHFIIPAKSFEKADKVTLPKEVFDPIPGFYRAVFIQSWKLFIKPENATGLVFVAAMISFKFFVGCPIISYLLLGCLFWYYMEIISSTAIEADVLPDVGMGGFYGFIWNIIKSLFLFALALTIVELPCIIFITIETNTGFELPMIRLFLYLAGLFVFPAAVLALAVTADISILFHPKRMIKPVVKAFFPYIVTVVLLITTWQLQIMTIDYAQLPKNTGNFSAGLHLFANLMVQVLAVISMRAIGLFYRHYLCYFDW